jgi:hypothetical protein
MLKPPPHRHSRHRNVWMEGLSTAGLSTNFEKVAVGILFLVGLVLVLNSRKMKATDLVQHSFVLLNAPYQAGSEARRQALIILPIAEGGKLLLVESFALKAANQPLLLSSLKKGDRIDVWVDAENEILLQKKNGGRRVKITLLHGNGQPLISEEAYNSALGNNSRAGWWVIAMALSMVPYFFIANPRIHPGWVLTLLITGMIAWLLWT